MKQVSLLLGVADFAAYEVKVYILKIILCFFVEEHNKPKSKKRKLTNKDYEKVSSNPC